MQAKVSVIIPCYKVEKYIDRCVNSVVNQTLKDLEIILVDDNSPDNTPIKCEEWVLMDDRIKVVHKVKNEGLGFARNTGLDIVSGEYFTFVDSDDYLEPETFEVAYKKASSGDFDICYYQYRRFSSGINLKSNKPKYGMEHHFRGGDDIKNFQLEMLGPLPQEKIRSRFCMSVCMGIFKTQVVKESGVLFMSERDVASEDMIFHMQLLPHINSVCILPNTFYNYFINPESITTSYSVKKRERLLNLLRIERSIMDKQFSWDEYKLHYYTEQIRILRVLMKYESRADYNIRKKCISIKRILSLDIFNELFTDNTVSIYRPFMCILFFLMKNRWSYLIVLLYRFNKKK